MVIAGNENYAMKMKDASKEQLSNLPNNMQLKMSLLEKNQWREVEVGVLKDSLQVASDFSSSGAMLFGLRYRNIKHCSITVNPLLPESVSVAQPSCCLRFT